MRRFFVLVVSALTLFGCGSSHTWHARDITGLMPPLEFSLRGLHGDVTANNFRGSNVLMFFGYTSCPDYCPTTLSKLHQAINALPAVDRDTFKVVFISVDPKRDSLSLLDSYAAAFGPEIIGLTGEVEALRELTKRYRTTFSYGTPDAHGNYEVSHGVAVYAFDRTGTARLMILDSQAAPQVTEDLATLATL